MWTSPPPFPRTAVYLACYHLAAEPESQATLADTVPLVLEVTHAVGFCLKPWGPDQRRIQAKKNFKKPAAGNPKVYGSAQRPVSTSLLSGHDSQTRGTTSWPVVHRDWRMVHKSVKECSLISSGNQLVRAAPFALHPIARPEGDDVRYQYRIWRQVCQRWRDSLRFFYCTRTRFSITETERRGYFLALILNSVLRLACALSTFSNLLFNHIAVKMHQK